MIYQHMHATNRIMQQKVNNQAKELTRYELGNPDALRKLTKLSSIVLLNVSQANP